MRAETLWFWRHYRPAGAHCGLVVHLSFHRAKSQQRRMSVQILLQGKLMGVEEFLPAGQPAEALLTGRLRWVSLLSEILPRALIAELGLSKMLLGSSGGDQFLVVLPDEVRSQAAEFLAAARSGIRELSQNRLELLWAITENLGDWTVVRKRLSDEFQRKQGTPLAATGFAQPPAATEPGSEYFESLGRSLRDAVDVGWSPESPATILTSGGKHSWTIGTSADSVPLARHTALTDDGREAATAPILASRAEGRPVWGVLRGDVDSFGIRMRRLQSIEEYVQLSVLYKQFFAGEVEVLCSLPEFWRKVNLLHTGGDDFAVYGAWDALIGFARELQRLFQRFTEEHLKEFPGPEGKTVTMALALAPELDTALGSVYGRSRDRLEIAKSADKDCFFLLGRTLEWKQLSDAAELKDELTAMVREFGVAPQYLRDLCGIYRETRRAPGAKRVERPWRFHRRLLRILGSSRSRDFQKARTGLIADLVGKNPANLKLRPSGRVALEWARLSTEGPSEN
jgi:CRISPR-associated protein Csm1